MNAKRAMFAALALGLLCGPAAAVSLNPRGLGQVLIYPYYTVNKSQDTMISVVNTTEVGKMVSVNFHEGQNGRVVFDFKLFLSPHDAWTATVTQVSGDGSAKIFTRDNSCVYPPTTGDNDIRGDGIPFRASAYAGGPVYPADGGPTSVMRTREGYIDLIELGEIIPGSPLDKETLHVQNGTPNAGKPTCAAATIGNNGGPWLSAPGGGISGAGMVVNVGEGTFFGYAANAISGFSDSMLFTASMTFPNLALANSNESENPSGAVAYLSNDAGKSFALDYARGIDAVSAVLMADAIDNDVLVGGNLAANTDWIVTFPTKPYYTDSYYTGSDTAAEPPFAEAFGQVHAGQSRVTVWPSVFDQEEGEFVPPTDWPLPVSAPLLPYVANAISFLPVDSGIDPAGVSGVFGSELVTNITPYGNAGWVKLDLLSGDGVHQLAADRSGVVMYGLPAVGFMVFNVINANAAPGKLANYSGLVPHRATVACTGPESAEGPCR